MGCARAGFILRFGKLDEFIQHFGNGMLIYVFPIFSRLNRTHLHRKFSDGIERSKRAIRRRGNKGYRNTEVPLTLNPGQTP